MPSPHGMQLPQPPHLASFPLVRPGSTDEGPLSSTPHEQHNAERGGARRTLADFGFSAAAPAQHPAASDEVLGDAFAEDQAAPEVWGTASAQRKQARASGASTTMSEERGAGAARGDEWDQEAEDRGPAPASANAGGTAPQAAQPSAPAQLAISVGFGAQQLQGAVNQRKQQLQQQRREPAGPDADAARSKRRRLDAASLQVGRGMRVNNAWHCDFRFGFMHYAWKVPFTCYRRRWNRKPGTHLRCCAGCARRCRRW